MNEKRLIVLTSLLTILLGTIHLADDINRGMSPGGRLNLVGVIICVVWLYATLLLAERRSGQVIIVLASCLVMAAPFIHLGGAGLGFGTVRSGGLFFIWTTLAIGVTGLFSILLSARALWRGSSI